MKWQIPPLQPDDDVDQLHKSTSAMLIRPDITPMRQLQIRSMFDYYRREKPELLEAYDVFIEYTGRDVRVWMTPKQMPRNRTRRP